MNTRQSFAGLGLCTAAVLSIAVWVNVAQAQTNVTSRQLGGESVAKTNQPGFNVTPQTRIAVFATTPMFVANATPNTVVYRVDERQRIEADLSANLPGDQAAAQKIVSERVRSMGNSLKARGKAAADALAASVQLGVNRIPAVVFDGQWVVYGSTDVAAAAVAAKNGIGASVVQRVAPGVAAPSQANTPNTTNTTNKAPR
jgi:integrating conjugative element protein (TIGR03757 family)